MKPLSLPLVPYLLVAILGVHFYFQEALSDKLLTIAISLISLVYFSFKSIFYWRSLFWGIIFFCLGFCTAHIDQFLPDKHYSQLTTTGINQIEIELQQRLRENTRNHRFYADITAVNGKPAAGKILLHVKKDSNFVPFLLGDKLLVSAPLRPIPSPLNPKGFNYKAYLEQLSIFHQIQTSSNTIEFLGHSMKTLFQSKNLVLKKLDESRLNSSTIAILKTMLLGERSSLDAQTRDQYAKAGVVHLFAISGLHVGLLMLLFQWLLLPLRALPSGHLIHLIGVLILLWCYAFFVGATASVLRSVTLFSAYHLGVQSHRRLPTAYLVLLSMGILVFFHPRFILQIGFQMSYLAVFGILYLHPLMHYKWNFKPLQWIWNLTTVCLAAQIAVAPISIYHFHQFPGLFLLTNWTILPFIGGFLYLGVGCILWLLFFPLPKIIITLMDWVVQKMNLFVSWVSHQEEFIFSSLVLDKLSLVLLYLILFCCIVGLHQKKMHWYLYAFCSLIILQMHLNTLTTDKEKKLWVTHSYGETIMVEKRGKSIIFHSNALLNEQHFIVRHFIRNFSHASWTTAPLFDGYAIDDQQLYIIGKDWPEELLLQENALILLKNNPTVNLERLIKKHSPKMVIIDGSNTPYYIGRWTISLEKSKTPYHITSTMGAYALSAKTWSEGF